jgi:hypothetical protein
VLEIDPGSGRVLDALANCLVDLLRAMTEVRVCAPSSDRERPEVLLGDQFEGRVPDGGQIGLDHPATEAHVSDAEHPSSARCGYERHALRLEVDHDAAEPFPDPLVARATERATQVAREGVLEEVAVTTLEAYLVEVNYEGVVHTLTFFPG